MLFGFYWVFCYFRKGPVKYKFQKLYELDSLAVVNVRDNVNIKNAFKILMFPDTRMFAAESPKAKVLDRFCGGFPDHSD